MESKTCERSECWMLRVKSDCRPGLLNQSSQVQACHVAATKKERSLKHKQEFGIYILQRMMSFFTHSKKNTQPLDLQSIPCLNFQNLTLKKSVYKTRSTPVRAAVEVKNWILAFCRCVFSSFPTQQGITTWDA